MSSCSGIRVVVDRIENGVAVLLVGSDEIRLDLPLDLLPPGTREGSLLRASFELDAGATEIALADARARIERLRMLSRK
ncbi:MAG: DUF3006 family protein [Bacillota bacterium]|nr:DUF3006 family protein [Bacillota bacterium]